MGKEMDKKKQTSYMRNLCLIKQSIVDDRTIEWATDALQDYKLRYYGVYTLQQII